MSAVQAFIYTGLPTRVVFGFGTLARLADETRALQCSRALILCTPRQTARAQELVTELDELAVGIFADATMHTPIEVTERALQMARQLDADCLIALGGGSTTGLGKALALRTDLPQIVIPTTYAGSETTPVVGETRDGHKTTQSSPAILPEVILYDVELTLSLPPALSAASGLNAIAHAVEALYARDANPLTISLARSALQTLFGALPKIVATPSDREARADALWGAWLCGVCLANGGMALHHKLCHVLGGAFNLPHAQTHAVILPHVLAYNASDAPQAMQRIAGALGVMDAVSGLFDFAVGIGAPTSLQALGMKSSELATAVDLAMANPYWNPRALEREGIARLLADAFYGRRPDASI